MHYQIQHYRNEAPHRMEDSLREFFDGHKDIQVVSITSYADASGTANVIVVYSKELEYVTKTKEIESITIRQEKETNK